MLDGAGPRLRRQHQPLLKMLKWMAELCFLLRERRGERGSLLMSLPEAEMVLDERGWPTDILRVDSLLSHQIIEEFMIAANEAVAAYLGEPSLFRVHERPDAVKKWRRSGTYLKGLGFVLPKEAHRNPRVLKEFLEEVRQTPLAPMVQLMLLRSLKQARYAGENLGHHGLAAQWYTHFTSPIRRYPDLHIHRLLLARLAHRHSNSQRPQIHHHVINLPLALIARSCPCRSPLLSVVNIPPMSMLNRRGDTVPSATTQPTVA